MSMRWAIQMTTERKKRMKVTKVIKQFKSKNLSNMLTNLSM